MSVLFHALLVLMLIGLLPHVPLPRRSEVGVPAPLEVALVNVPVIAFVPPPEMPEPAVEIPPAPPQAVAPPPRIEPKIIPEPPPPVPAPPPKPAVPMAPLGVSVQADASGTTVANDVPPPPGDIAIGSVQNLARISGTQALRLSQRFPMTASRPPQLRDPLVVLYPPDAARAHLEARIAALVLVDAEGKITETTLYPDEARFGPSVADAMKNARMTPAEIDGKPVAYWTILEFVFTMRRPPAPRPPQ